MYIIIHMAELNIFGQIGKTASDEDVVESFTAVDMAVFLSANNMDSSHTINIKSGGGYVEEGFEIYDMLRSSGKHITTVAQQADSIASVIFLAGDIRKMSKNAKPLIHFPFLENFFIDRATAQDFAEIHKGIKSLENKILSIYIERTGANKQTLELIMSKNESIDATLFHKLGFATELTDSEVVNQYKAVAKSINNNSQMDKKELTSWLTKLEDMIKNLVKSKVKNLAIMLEDGSTVVHIQTEEESAKVGDTVWMDEEYTVAAPDATHVLENGLQVVTVDGVITEIIEPVAKKDDEDVEALKAENETLKAEIETLKASKAEAENKLQSFAKAKAENEKSLSAVKAEFEKLQAMVLDIKDDKNELPVSKAQEDLEYRRKLRNISKA